MLPPIQPELPRITNYRYWLHQIFEINTESAEALHPEAVDVARDIARINSPALRKQVSEAIRTFLSKYFE